ncbi:hypothetical protein ACWEOZ_02080 [Actinoplanes sp. NPDC004185]
MATVARLLPRYWDGRRLLQFLAGLALIALAFALPSVLSPAETPADAPVTIVTTVDTPAGPALPVIEVPGPRLGGSRAGLALSAAHTATGVTRATDAAGTADTAETAQAADAAGTVQAAGAAGTADAAGTTDVARAAESDAPGAGPVTAGTVQGVPGLPVHTRHDGRGVCVEARAAVDGATPRTHGQRGPPRA